VVRTLTIIDWISLLIAEQVSSIVRSMCFIHKYRFDLIQRSNRLLCSRFGDYPKSRSRLGLTFDNVCVRRKLIESKFAPS
jgi:hypothetical protein